MTKRASRHHVRSSRILSVICAAIALTMLLSMSFAARHGRHVVAEVEDPGQSSTLQYYPMQHSTFRSGGSGSSSHILNRLNDDQHHRKAVGLTSSGKPIPHLSIKSSSGARGLRGTIAQLLQDTFGGSSIPPPSTPNIIYASPLQPEGYGSLYAPAPVPQNYYPPQYAPAAPDPPAADPTGNVPVDQVALAAAGNYDYGDGGISVVTSNPISLSNPINLNGGNYNGQGSFSG